MQTLTSERTATSRRHETYIKASSKSSPGFGISGVKLGCLGRFVNSSYMVEVE